MKPSPSYRQWLTTFIIYNFVFFILQLSFILLNNHHVNFINAIHLPPIVYLSLMGTLMTHLCLYLLLSLIQTTFLWGINQYQLSPRALEHWHLAIWCASVSAILALNGYFFPLSLFSRLFLPELPQAILMAILLISLGLIGLLLFNTIFFLGKKYPKQIGGLAMLMVGFILYKAKEIDPKIPQHQITTAPNIIMIGIDSLSPRKINDQETPTLARFIQKGVLFKETITPLANTYPAWASILTGLYPEHNQARYNLMPPDAVKSSQSIAWLLQKKGYQTLFATDDRQFNMLGKEFGFQTMIGPRGGANDFLISALNDFPLSNLLVNLPISHWLFPYNYSNRASYITYYPQSFDKQLQQALAHNDHRSPSFMAIHFTLPHWPYLWAESTPETNNPNDDIKIIEQHHQMALHRVDQQVSHLINLLQHYGYLDNGMLILLSDHGEGFYFQGSRQTSPLFYQGRGVSRFSNYLKKNTSTVLDRSAGHGSDLLSADQYHCLLAFKIYQQARTISLPKIIRPRVSLLDIAPTILSYLKIPDQPTDGVSLLPSIISSRVRLPQRAFIMESGMMPNQLLTSEKIKSLAKTLFTIDAKHGHLYLRHDQLNALDTAKLYGIIKGNWMMALYPDEDGYLPITLHLTNGQWTDELRTDFAIKSPAISLLDHINHFYHKTWKLSELQKSI